MGYSNKIVNKQIMANAFFFEGLGALYWYKNNFLCQDTGKFDCSYYLRHKKQKQRKILRSRKIGIYCKLESTACFLVKRAMKVPFSTGIKE